MTVNGQPASAGQQVSPGLDEVRVAGRVIELEPQRAYLLMNKPVGVLTSVGDPRGRPTVTDGLPTDLRLFPVGRLDLDSRGMILLTDDGELAMRLMHPRYRVEKEYHVVISGRPDPSTLSRLKEGMVVRGEHFEPVEVGILATSPETTRVSMVLHEGRKREIRRLWRALGHRVIDLQRVRIDGLQLGTLGEGQRRPLTATEVARLKAAVS